MGLSGLAHTGGFAPFPIRWVLVDTRAEAAWLALPRSKKQTIHAVIAKKDAVKDENDVVFSTSDRDQLDKVGIGDGITFRLYAIEDVAVGPPVAYQPGKVRDVF
jgi:hypothetical protein